MTEEDGIFVIMEALAAAFCVDSMVEFDVKSNFVDDIVFPE